MAFLFSHRKRLYLSHALYFVRKCQDPNLPSCENTLRQIIFDSLAHTKTASIPYPPHRAAETSVYRISLDLFDSPRYRNVFGLPTESGEQLCQICRSALDVFLEKGYVSREEYDEHSGYLLECELDFEKYGLYPRA